MSLFPKQDSDKSKEERDLMLEKILKTVEVRSKLREKELLTMDVESDTEEKLQKKVKTLEKMDQFFQIEDTVPDEPVAKKIV